MTTKTPGKKREAFPFETENPSGVPGTTEIADDVVAAIAGHTASQVEGVVRLGTGGILRTVAGAVASDAAAKGAGVDVEAGLKEAIFDIELTVQYGHSIPNIVKSVRENVALELRDQVGLVAKEINVKVAAIEFSEEAPTTATRVE